MKSTKNSIIALLFSASQVNASATADESYDQTLASCLSFAGKFENTCTDQTTSQAFSSLASVTKTCTSSYGNWANCPTGGTVSGDDCSYDRILCVSCFEENSVVRIRAQSNGLASHCGSAAGQVAIEPIEMDFTVDWLSAPSTSTQTVAQGIDNQDDLDSLVCNILRSSDSNIPDSCNYSRETDSQRINVAWGFATSGVMFFSSLSAEKVDPFYPVYYDGNTNLDAEKVDKCMMHPQAAGLLHYHSASTCIADPDYITTAPNGANTEVMATTKSVFADKLPYRTAMGISKDGRPVYTPQYDNGKEYSGCDVDICNGITIDGHYSYVSTMFHPYIIGCYGPGSSPALYQQCSGNPRLCGVTYTAQTEEQANGRRRESMGAVALSSYMSLAAITALTGFTLY